MSDATTYQVQFWKLRKSEGRRRPWSVRWKTAGREHSESYTTKALAESFRAELVKAARAGEAFEVASGLPLSLLRQRGVQTFLDLAVAYVDHLWPTAPPNARRAAVVNLAAAVPKFVTDLDQPTAETELQRLTSTHLLPPPRRDDPLTAEDRAVASWLRRASRPVSDLTDPLAIAGLLHNLGVAADGRPVTSSTWDKRRAVLHRLAGYAVDTGVLVTNPVTGRRVRTGKATEGVDPRVVVNPDQARQLLAAITYVSGHRGTERDHGWRLRAFFACLYYAGLRPGEAQHLRDTDAKLPAEGWGELVLSGSRTGVSGEHYNELPRRRPATAQAASSGSGPPRPDPAGPRRDPARAPRPLRHRARRPTLPRPDDRRAHPGVGVHPHLEAGARDRPEPRTAGLAARRSALRPAPRRAVVLAQRRGAAHRGRRARRPLGQGPALGLRGVPRRRAGCLQRPHREASRP